MNVSRKLKSFSTSDAHGLIRSLTQKYTNKQQMGPGVCIMGLKFEEKSAN